MRQYIIVKKSLLFRADIKKLENNGVSVIECDDPDKVVINSFNGNYGISESELLKIAINSLEYNYGSSESAAVPKARFRRLVTEFITKQIEPAQ